jgi:glycerol-3-phosphate dehydrogenase
MGPHLERHEPEQPQGYPQGLRLRYNPSTVETFDLIILGGGISGLGVAREAAHQKRRTLLLEAHACCSATSNNTLRIIHGGFRYLQHGDLPRVIKSLLDQKALLREAPDAVVPLPCVMPLKRFGLKSRIPVTCAAVLYGAIMRLCGSPLKRPSVLSAAAVNETIPLLRGLAPHGALCWNDAVMIDPRRVTEMLMRKAQSGSVEIKEHTPVASVTRVDDLFEVRASCGTMWRSRAVANTLGPWISKVDIPEYLHGEQPLWCKGFNITISRQLDPSYGIGVEGDDGRLFFCVPRGQGSAIGTWYVPCAHDGVTPSLSEQEIESFITAFNRALPGANVRAAEIVATDVGILPMVKDSPRGPLLVSNERIHTAGLYAEVISTKYTTFRAQGRKVLRALS